MMLNGRTTGASRSSRSWLSSYNMIWWRVDFDWNNLNLLWTQLLNSIFESLPARNPTQPVLCLFKLADKHLTHRWWTVGWHRFPEHCFPKWSELMPVQPAIPVSVSPCKHLMKGKQRIKVLWKWELEWGWRETHRVEVVHELHLVDPMCVSSDQWGKRRDDSTVLSVMLSPISTCHHHQSPFHRSRCATQASCPLLTSPHALLGPARRRCSNWLAPLQH